MSGYLCLKWNNHSSAIQKSISSILNLERYCDATIACQGKYFPVHRIILSTCSEYFEEIFEKMKCQHPYIVFKDIEPKEMEMLLSYMYQGEVNVVQEALPSLIKAAEALKIKGLAVPDEDDVSSKKESSSGKRRSSSTNDNPQSKRRLDEAHRKSESSDKPNSNVESTCINTDMVTEVEASCLQPEYVEPRLIKEEPLESVEGVFPNLECDLNSNVDHANPVISSLSNESERNSQQNFDDYQLTNDSSSCMKLEDDTNMNVFIKQPSEWNEFTDMNATQENIHLEDIMRQSNVSERDFSECGQEKGNSFLFNAASTSKATSSAGSRRCPHCHYTAQAPSHVRRHIRYKHTGEKPCACPHCPARFHATSNLDRHIKFKHTGERPFSCSLCSKRFVVKKGLERHMLIHTGVKPF